jgi:hypothetical protein
MINTCTEILSNEMRVFFFSIELYKRKLYFSLACHKTQTCVKVNKKYYPEKRITPSEKNSVHYF